MCGRFSLDPGDPEIADIVTAVRSRIGFRTGAEPKTGEIAPTDTVPVLAVGSAGMRAEAMSWGFPRWDGKGVVFNARAETALKKSMFRDHLRSSPVVVPTTGFFEWKPARSGDPAGSGRRAPAREKKEKFLFREEGRRVLWLAGFAAAFPSASGRADDCFTILTVPANESVSPYHDRMPLVLRKAEIVPWLSGEEFEYFLTRTPFPLTAAPDCSGFAPHPACLPLPGM